MTNEEKDKKEYELALLLNSEDNLAGVIKLVGTHNAEGVTEARAKRLQLAYEIKKHTEAVFAYFTFKMFGDDMKALEHELNTHAMCFALWSSHRRLPPSVPQRPPCRCAKSAARVTRLHTLLLRHRQKSRDLRLLSRSVMKR